MKRWLRRIRGAIGMGLTWAVGWSLTGVLIGVAWNLGVPMEWFIRVFDAPLPALAVPGFFAGTTFSVVLGIAGRRRRFDELSLPKFAAWGAAGGLMLGLVPIAAAGAGMSGATMAVALGTLTLLSGASATVSLAVARRADARELPDAGGDIAEAGLSPGPWGELPRHGE
jgi:hypothetical protein